MAAFSLTPDPRFYFRSRSHGRVFDALSAAIRRRESLMLVLGDLGVGKSTLCRTLLETQDRTRAALVCNALLSPEDFVRLMLQDLGAISKDEVAQGQLNGLTRAQLIERADAFVKRLEADDSGAVMIVDEAHTLPPATQDAVLEIASLESNRNRVLQFLLAAQPAIGGATLPALADDRLSVRARLLPLERDECGRYVSHRLAVGGAGAGTLSFTPQAIDVIYTLSGGMPRLVNLLCERASQEASTAGASTVEPRMVESAASVLDLMRLKPKRFRWYGGSARRFHT